LTAGIRATLIKGEPRAALIGEKSMGSGAVVNGTRANFITAGRIFSYQLTISKFNYGGFIVYDLNTIVALNKANHDKGGDDVYRDAKAKPEKLSPGDALADAASAVLDEIRSCRLVSLELKHAARDLATALVDSTTFEVDYPEETP
jgi:hypothetical protein